MKSKNLRLTPVSALCFTRMYLFLILAGMGNVTAAQPAINLDQAIQIALENNPGIKSAAYEIDYYKEIKKTSTDIGKLNAVWMHGQYNSIYQDNNYTVTQAIPFPTVLTSQSRLGKEQVLGAFRNLQAVKNDLVFEVKSEWYELLYLESLHNALLSMDSLYTGFANASSARYKTGESNLLEKTTAETQSLEAKNQILQNGSEIRILQTKLQALLKSDSPIITNEVLRKKELDTDTSSIESNPRLSLLQQQVIIAAQARRVERNKILPDLTVGYFNQSLIGVQNVNGQDVYYGRSKHFQGFEMGLAIPLWIAPNLARVKSYGFREEALKKNAEYYLTTLTSSYTQAVLESQKNLTSLRYYEESALPNAELILKQAQRAWSGGEIGYIEYLQSLRMATGIRERYLQALNQYNQSVIKIDYLLGTF
jgi:heavy metal efflux system protein